MATTRGRSSEHGEVSAESRPLRVQHGRSGADTRRGQEAARGRGNAQKGVSGGLGRVKTPEPGTAVRVTVRLGFAPNSLGFWRRRRYRTAALFAEALAETTGLKITAAYVRYWESAVGVPPGPVVEAVSRLLETPPTLIWAQEQLRAL